MNKIYLSRIYLNQGGYDRRGSYYGIGMPVYRCFVDGDNYEDGDDFRSYDRESAKAHVRSKHPEWSHYPFAR